MDTTQKYTRQQIFELLGHAINRSLKASGKQAVSLSWDMKPLLAIADLDSQMGVEVTLELELALGVAIDLGTNLLIEDSGATPRARKVKETVSAILSTLGGSS
jgi:hypothetical protein